MTRRGPRSEPVALVAPAAPGGDPVVQGLVCEATAQLRAIVWRRKLFEFVASRRIRDASSSNWRARRPIYSAQQRRLNGARWTKSPAATDAESRLVVAAMLVQAKCTTRPCYAKAIPRSTQTWISHTSQHFPIPRCAEAGAGLCAAWRCLLELEPKWFSFFFFRAQAVEEALRKDRECPVEKETPKRKGTSGREEAQPPPPDVEAWSSSQC